jgi:hypothetical protein
MQQITEDLKNYPSWLTEHPITKAIVEENQQQIMARRKSALATLDRVRHEQEKALPKLINAISQAEEALAAAKKNVTEKEKALTGAVHRKLTASLESGAAIAAQESILRETSDPAIYEAIKYFNGKLAALRKPEAIKSQDYPGVVDLYSEKRTPFSHSNIEALRAAIEYSQNAVKEAEALKLTAVYGAALQKRLDELKANIPDSEATKLYQAE